MEISITLAEWVEINKKRLTRKHCFVFEEERGNTFHEVLVQLAWRGAEKDF